MCFGLYARNVGDFQCCQDRAVTLLLLFCGGSFSLFIVYFILFSFLEGNSSAQSGSARTAALCGSCLGTMAHRLMKSYTKSIYAATAWASAVGLLEELKQEWLCPDAVVYSALTGLFSNHFH